MSGRLVITVVRTGGFAGLERRWSITADTDADEWIPLVDACPWASVYTDALSRDRFVYRIEVSAPKRRRRAELPEAAVTGPWRILIERVQDAG
jgi:hypothetical protein